MHCGAMHTYTSQKPKYCSRCGEGMVVESKAKPDADDGGGIDNLFEVGEESSVKPGAFEDGGVEFVMPHATSASIEDLAIRGASKSGFVDPKTVKKRRGPKKKLTKAQREANIEMMRQRSASKGSVDVGGDGG